MQATLPWRGLAAALLSGALLLTPAAQAGVFSANAYLDVTLTSVLPDDVTLTYANDVWFEDDFASNPPWSFFDADAVFIDEPSLGAYGTLLTIWGEALGVRGSELGEVASQRLTEGSIQVANDSAAEVSLDFEYFYAIIAEVFAQATGPSAARAFARVHLFWTIQDVIGDVIGDVIALDLVVAALDGTVVDTSAGGGSFTLIIPDDSTATLWFFVDAGGEATHVPAPASLALFAFGLGLLGLRRRRTAACAIEPAAVGAASAARPPPLRRPGSRG
jgi:hypothetical protein